MAHFHAAFPARPRRPPLYFFGIFRLNLVIVSLRFLSSSMVLASRWPRRTSNCDRSTTSSKRRYSERECHKDILPLANVHGAMAFYYDNQAAINVAIRQARELGEQLGARSAQSALKEIKGRKNAP